MDVIQEARPSGPVLLIDDSDDIRELFAIWMKLEGYQAETMASAEQALSALAKGLNPSLILVDLTMPGMDGYEFVRVLRVLRDRRLAADVPVYVFSGTSLDTPIAGTSGTIHKPMDFEQVLGLVRQMGTAVSK